MEQFVSTAAFDTYRHFRPVARLVSRSDGQFTLNHKNLRAVRRFYQNLASIDKYIEDERFYENDALVQAEEPAGAYLSRTFTIIVAAGGHLPVTTDHDNVKHIVCAKAQRLVTLRSSGLVSPAGTGTSNLTFAGEKRMCCVAPTLQHLPSRPVADRMRGEVLMCGSKQAQASA